MRPRWQHIREAALALAAAGMIAALPVPAVAQFPFGFGYRYDYGYQRPSRPPPPRGGFFQFPFFSPGPGGNEPGQYSNPQYRPQAPAESNRAPPPRKLDNPPANTVVVVGDSMADWLAYGLEEALGDTPDIGVERKVRTFSGLIHYDSKNDTLEWPAAIKDALAAEKPSAVVVMLGLSDRVSIRDHAPARPGAQPQGADKAAASSATPAQQDRDQAPSSEPDHAGPGVSYEFHTDKWAELYGKRIDDMIAALKTKGVPVLWVGLPALRGQRSTSDMSYLDELYREHAEKAGIVYVDIWDGFVDDEGRYAVQGPDFEGQTRRLRTGDGVHFTKAGAVKLASFVEQQLRRVMANHVAPVALPGPEATSPAAAGGTGKGGATPGASRPVVGPVVPLTASLNGGTDNNDLVGAANHAAPPAAHDPLAADVLSRGDPIPAAPGRADDFSWPRPGNAAGTAATEPAPAAPTPPAKPPAAGTAKKPADSKAKAKPSPAAAAAPRAQLDGTN